MYDSMLQLVNVIHCLFHFPLTNRYMAMHTHKHTLALVPTCTPYTLGATIQQAHGSVCIAKNITISVMSVFSGYFLYIRRKCPIMLYVLP